MIVVAVWRAGYRPRVGLAVAHGRLRGAVARAVHPRRRRQHASCPDRGRCCATCRSSAPRARRRGSPWWPRLAWRCCSPARWPRSAALSATPADDRGTIVGLVAALRAVAGAAHAVFGGKFHRSTRSSPPIRGRFGSSQLPFGVRDGASVGRQFQRALSVLIRPLHGKRLIGGYLSRISKRRVERGALAADARCPDHARARAVRYRAEHAAAIRARAPGFLAARQCRLRRDRSHAGAGPLIAFVVDAWKLEEIARDGPIVLYRPTAARTRTLSGLGYPRLGCVAVRTDLRRFGRGGSHLRSHLDAPPHPASRPRRRGGQHGAGGVHGRAGARLGMGGRVGYGWRSSDRDDLLRWSHGMLASLTGEPAALEAAAAAFGEYVAYAHRMIAARRAEPTDDLFSVLVHAEVDGDRLDDDEIVFESLLLLIGGDETTRQVTAAGWSCCSRTPTAAEAARRPRLAAVGASRRCSAGCRRSRTWPAPPPATSSSAGQPLPAGDKVVLLYESANFDDTPLRRARALRHRAVPERPPRVRLRAALLPRREPRPARAPGDVRTAAAPAARPRARRPTEPLPRSITGIERMPVVFSPSRPMSSRERCV